MGYLNLKCGTLNIISNHNLIESFLELHSVKLSFDIVRDVHVMTEKYKGRCLYVKDDYDGLKIGTKNR